MKPNTVGRRKIAAGHYRFRVIFGDERTDEEYLGQDFTARRVHSSLWSLKGPNNTEVHGTIFANLGNIEHYLMYNRRRDLQEYLDELDS